MGDQSEEVPRNTTRKKISNLKLAENHLFHGVVTSVTSTHVVHYRKPLKDVGS